MLSACSTMDIVKNAGKAVLGGGSDSGLSVDTELVVGDKNQQAEVQVGDRSQQQAESIANTQINNISPFVLLLLILGWLLPSPQEIWGGFVSLLPWVRKK